MVTGQASGAQREPSMEEILASIRRIIEDSDSLRPDAPAASAAPKPDAAAVSGPGEVEAFRAGLDEPAVAAYAVPGDVSGLPAPDAVLPPAETPQAGPANVASAAQPPVEADAADPGSGQDEDMFPELAQLGEALPDAETASEPRPAIISDHAGRQVAAAFGELSEAFAASRRRSFDEMAEEMLRPMLQDWLDNNLPMLVERLVREEIERVARGG